MNFAEIAYYRIGGLPFISYLGILTYSSFALTALTSYLNRKGKRWIPFRWHPRLAVFSLILGIIHGLLAFSIYL